MGEIGHASLSAIGDPAQRAARAPVSIIICTHDRPRSLKRTLASLADQCLAPNEIIVVDNAPPDERTRQLVARSFPAVLYVREGRRGLDFARNRGLLEARSEVVAFIDDDMVVDHRWCERIAHTFADSPEVGACTGRVEPLELETEAQRLFEANGGYSRGKKLVRLPPQASQKGLPIPLIARAIDVGVGGSFAVRKSVALAAGGFDEALGLRPVLAGGDDLDMLWRILCSGYHVIYQPTAVAWHAHRRRMPELADQLCGHHKGLVAFLVKSLARASGARRLPIFAFLVWRLVKPGTRLVARAIRRDPLPAPMLFRIWLNCWAGLAAYPIARRVARQRRAEASNTSGPPEPAGSLTRT